MVADQIKDKELLKIKEELESGKASQAFNTKYILLDNVLYYLSKADSDPVIQFSITDHLRKEVIEQCHDINGHMGIGDAGCNQNKVHPIQDQLPGEHTGLPSHMRQNLFFVQPFNAALINTLTHGR